MMYHFMFGLRGASAVAAAPSAPALCGSLVGLGVASFFSSSGIESASSFTLRTDVISAACLEQVEQIAHAMLDEEIDHPEVEGEDGDGDDDDRGGGLNFLPRGSGHLAHFGAHVVVEGPDSLRPGFYPVSKAATGCCN